MSKIYVISDTVNEEWDEVFYLNLLMRLPSRNEDEA